jgi:hypothetical protein
MIGSISSSYFHYTISEFQDFVLCDDSDNEKDISMSNLMQEENAD